MDFEMISVSDESGDQTVAPPAPPPTRCSIATASDRQALAFDEAAWLLAMASIVAPPTSRTDDSDKRPPLDLVAVVDRSGSMKGERIQLMRQTLELLVTRAGLNEVDRFSLVSFDHTVAEEVPLQSMDAQGRARAQQVISRLQTGGSTNLSGGLLHGIDVLGRQAEKSQGRTRAVMLFTDGDANHGITLTAQLVSALHGALESSGTSASCYTFGFGSNHNEDMLRAIAEATNAQYYYVRSADDIPASFADCLGGLVSVVAQNACLTIEPATAPAEVSVRPVAKQAAATNAPLRKRVHARWPFNVLRVRSTPLDSDAPHASADVVAIIPAMMFGELELEVESQGACWKVTSSTLERLWECGFGQSAVPPPAAYIVKTYAQEGTEGTHETLEDVQDKAGADQTAAGSAAAADAGAACAVLRVLGQYKVQQSATGLSCTINLGDLYAEDHKDLLIELALPALMAQAAARPLMTATLRYFSVCNARFEEVSSVLEVARPVETPVSQTCNLQLDEQRNRMRVAESMEVASSLADTGRLREGRAVLSQCAAELSGSPSASSTLSSNLLRELQALMVQYEDKTRYTVMGSKMSKMSAMSHHRQRANHTNSDMYSGGQVSKAAMKRSWAHTV